MLTGVQVPLGFVYEGNEKRFCVSGYKQWQER